MNHTYKTLLLITILAVGLGCGYSKKTTTMPTIMQLNPASETHGSMQFQLEVDGSNFASNAVVNFNGTPEPTTFVSSTKLEAMIPSTAIMSAGMVPVTVTNPGGSGGIYGTSPPVTSAPMNFTIN
jgi:IPT/TIG domain-containing protein